MMWVAWWPLLPLATFQPEIPGPPFLAIDRKGVDFPHVFQDMRSIVKRIESFPSGRVGAMKHVAAEGRGPVGGEDYELQPRLNWSVFTVTSLLSLYWDCRTHRNLHNNKQEEQKHCSGLPLPLLPLSGLFHCTRCTMQ